MQTPTLAQRESALVGVRSTFKGLELGFGRCSRSTPPDLLHNGEGTHLSWRMREILRRRRLCNHLALLKSSAEQSRSGAPAAFLFQQKRDEGVASTRFGSFSTAPARVLVA